MAEYNVQINKYNANNLGYDQLYPQPMKHADTHLLNGSDPINVGGLGVSNRNILDDWYFGNPVDQRGGYVVPPGVAYFEIGSGTQIGTLSTYSNVVRFVVDGSTRFPIIKIGGVEYFASPTSEVRGYVGAGYTIDRWKQQAGIVSTIVDGAIRLICVASTGQLFEEVIDGVTPGSTVTVSILVISVSGNSSMAYIVNSATNSVLKSFKLNSTGLFTATITIPSGCNALSVRFNPTVVGETIDVRAAKFELGTVQTLAHQDADGNWVLNDPPPDKGMELLKCQMYQRPIAGRYVPILNTADYLWFWIPLSPCMRITPEVVLAEVPSVFVDGSIVSGFTFGYDKSRSSKYGVLIYATKASHGLSGKTIFLNIEETALADANL